MSYHIERIPNRANKPAILLREAWREGKRIRKRTIANLSKFPPEIVAGFRTVLKGGIAVKDPSELFVIERSWPHGHVVALLGTCRRLSLERILHSSPSRQRDLALAAIVARILDPCSELATARRLSPATADSSLSTLLGLGEVSGEEMLAMLDWLRSRQRWIEANLGRRHGPGASLVLHDASSSRVEKGCCPPAAHGHSRDGEVDNHQIVYGLLCTADGCPLAARVFSGNTADPTTLSSQVRKVQERLGIDHIALVGDSGILGSLPQFSAGETVADYERLVALERAFRAATDHIRPMHAYSEERARGHVLLCMLAYFVEWHVRRSLAPVLPQIDDPEAAQEQRNAPVEEAPPFSGACDKLATKTTADGFRVESFEALLAHLGTLTLNQVNLPSASKPTIAVGTRPTAIQRKAFELLQVDPHHLVPIRSPV